MERECEVRECIPTHGSVPRLIIKAGGYFFRMDVIGSIMTRDVFVAPPSVLTSESTESFTFVDKSEISQREAVVTDRKPETSRFFFLAINSSRSLVRRLADRCPCELLASEQWICSSSKWIVLVLENLETNAWNKWPVYQHPVLCQQQ